MSPIAQCRKLFTLCCGPQQERAKKADLALSNTKATLFWLKGKHAIMQSNCGVSREALSTSVTRLHSFCRHCLA